MVCDFRRYSRTRKHTPRTLDIKISWEEGPKALREMEIVKIRVDS